MMEKSSELQKIYDEHKMMKETLERISEYDEIDGQEEDGGWYAFYELRKIAENTLDELS